MPFLLYPRQKIKTKKNVNLFKKYNYNSLESNFATEYSRILSKISECDKNILLQQYLCKLILSRASLHEIPLLI
jgi:hypothetical protein